MVWSTRLIFNDLAIDPVIVIVIKKKPMFKIGGMKVVKQTIIPKLPTTDFIKFKLPTTELNASPSAPPIIGMKLLETNFAVFIPKLSELTEIDVCRENRPMKIVTIKIKINITIFLTVEVIGLICRLEFMLPTREKARNAPVVGRRMFEIVVEMNWAMKKSVEL